MVLFNYSTRELTAKIVYYGPGLCGKTTNLQYIYGSLPESVKKGKMLSLATKTDRTLFFDFLPIELGTIRGMRTRVQLYTVPGQVFYNSTRKLVLKGADGVVFVADSQSKMLEADIESYRNLEENLREMGIRIEEIPLVMQFNKRDLPNLSSIEEMNTRINRHNAPFYETVAMTGIGVEDTLKAITKLVLNNLSAKYRLDEAGVASAGAKESGAHPVAAPPPAAPSRPAPAARRASDKSPRPAPPPEELALDALDVDQDETRGAEDVIDLVDEIAADQPASADALDLDDEILEEIDEPPPVTRLPAARRPPMMRQAPAPAPVPAARASAVGRALAVKPDPLDVEEPIDLDEVLEEEQPAARSIPAAAAASGSKGEIELPLKIEVGGKTVHIQLRLKVRISD